MVKKTNRKSPLRNVKLVQPLSLPHLSSKTVVRTVRPRVERGHGVGGERAWGGSEGTQRGADLWKLTEKTAPKDRSGRSHMHVVN